MSWIALKARVDCPECGQPAMLEGPWEKLRCPSCHSESKVGYYWPELIASAQSQAPGGRRFAPKFKPGIFSCTNCGGNLNITTETTRIVTCPPQDASAASTILPRHGYRSAWRRWRSRGAYVARATGVRSFALLELTFDVVSVATERT